MTKQVLETLEEKNGNGTPPPQTKVPSRVST
jgi:hypothetical protein